MKYYRDHGDRSPADGGGKNLGTIYVSDHKGGHLVGAPKKFVSKSKTF